MGQVEFRTNANGYLEFWNEDERRWMLRHRWIMGQFLGRPIPDWLEVHHIDKDRKNNSPANLVVVTPEVHRQLHKAPESCYKCGHTDHWAKDCRAKKDVGGNALPLQW